MLLKEAIYKYIQSKGIGCSYKIRKSAYWRSENEISLNIVVELFESKTNFGSSQALVNENQANRLQTCFNQFVLVFRMDRT